MKLKVLTRCAAIVCFGCLWLCGLSWAQQDARSTLPEALSKIPAATGVCRRSDLVNIQPTPSEESFQVDGACVGAVPPLLPLHSRADVIWIDTRSLADYQTFHINSALNLTPAEVRSKPHWRDKTLVLIGSSAKAETALYRECTRLKQLGFSHVQVMQGGMATWLSWADVRTLAGQLPTAASLMRLTAAEFWLELQAADHLLLTPAAFALPKKGQQAGQTELTIALKHAQTMPQFTSQSLQAAVQRRTKSSPKNRVNRVIAVTDDDVSDEQAQSFQNAIKPLPLLIYRADHDAYAREVNTQKAIWKAQTAGPKQPGCGL
jgi:rhodanese-related sulfurtransferase